MTAQRIPSAHLKPEAPDTFWAGIDLDLTGRVINRLRHGHRPVTNDLVKTAFENCVKELGGR
jgi:hypothetical protein